MQHHTLKRVRGIVSILLLALLTAVEASFVDQWLGIGLVVLVTVSPLSCFASSLPPFMMNTHGSTFFQLIFSCVFSSQIWASLMYLLFFSYPILNQCFSSLTAHDFFIRARGFPRGYLLFGLVSVLTLPPSLGIIFC